jgi:hypothetical protein
MHGILGFIGLATLIVFLYFMLKFALIFVAVFCGAYDEDESGDEE